MKKSITDAELFELANKARELSYSPYSNVTVGAALMTSDGKTYTGQNIENSAFSPSVCAERVALFKAISEGERNFSAIAVAGGKKGEAPKSSFPPCGVCRQVMSEFVNGDFRIILSPERSYTLSELLPESFGKEMTK